MLAERQHFLEIFSEVVKRLVESGLAVETYTETVDPRIWQVVSKIDYLGSEDYSNGEYFVFNVWNLQVAFGILVVDFYLVFSS